MESPDVELNALPPDDAERTEPVTAPTMVDGAPGDTAPASHFGIWWLIALFFSFRWLALLLLRPGGYIRDWSDFDTFFGIASMSDYGLLPFFHFWLEWPPIVPWMAVAAYKLSLLIPPWPDDPRLWFVLILGTVFVLFETGNLYLVYRISSLMWGGDGEAGTTGATATADGHADRRETDARILRPVWLYALLFIPLYTMLGFFDAVALFFLLLALYALLRTRTLSSAMAVGVGIVTKLTPVVLLPVALRVIWSATQSTWVKVQDCALYVVCSLLSVVALLAPFLFTRPEWLVAMGRAVAGRSSWETVWALLEGYTGFGVVTGNRLNPMETNFAVHGTSLPWWAITLVFAALYLVAWTERADFSRPRNVVTLTGFTVTLFMLYSKGFSPQFLVYALPFIVLLLPNRRGVVYCLLLTILNVLEQPVFFVMLPNLEPLLLLVLVTRWLSWGALLLEFSFVLWGAGWRLLAPVRRYAPATLMVLFSLGMLALLPLGMRQYRHERLVQEPAGDLVGFLRTEAAGVRSDLLLLTDRDLLRRLSPFLSHMYRIRLVGGASEFSGATSFAELAAESPTAWLVVDGLGGTQDQRAQLAELGTAQARYRFEPDASLTLYSLADEPAPGGALARLSSGANLMAFTVEHPVSNQLRVTLYWLCTDPPDESYTAFVQLTTDEGRYVSGHDAFPDNGNAPTQSWQSGFVYADAHVISVPANIPPGTYALIAGMYDVNMQRAVATGQGASPFPGNAIPLSEIDLP